MWTFRFFLFSPLAYSGVRSGRSRGERRREAVVARASYKVVGSALLVAEMSVSFLQFAAHFPAIGTDVLTRIGELLRVGCVVGEKCSCRRVCYVSFFLCESLHCMSKDIFFV